VADLVPEVPEQGAVGLVHRHPQLLAVHVVALGQVQRDHPFVVAGDHLLELAGQQVERQPVDRQLQLVQLGDQPAFGLLGDRERGQRVQVVVAGSGAGQYA